MWFRSQFRMFGSQYKPWLAMLSLYIKFQFKLYLNNLSFSLVFAPIQDWTANYIRESYHPSSFPIPSPLLVFHRVIVRIIAAFSFARFVRVLIARREAGPLSLFAMVSRKQCFEYTIAGPHSRTRIKMRKLNVFVFFCVSCLCGISSFLKRLCRYCASWAFCVCASSFSSCCVWIWRTPGNEW